MKSVSLSPREFAPSVESPVTSAADRLRAYVSLTKPRIVFMVLMTVLVGYFLGARGSSHPAAVFYTLLGTGLVAASASCLNQWMERARDARMRRTANRALPRRRVSPLEASILGVILGSVGMAILLAGANCPAAAVAGTTLLLYVLVYTPLKPRTTLNTAIGAIPGALPPAIGWAAATGTIGIEAFSLFLIVFLWQFPHFLAIAWLYREDYARGGMRMLPNVDPDGSITARQATLYALALVPASLLPTIIGLAGDFYFAAALVLSLVYLAAAVRFLREISDANARRLLRTSFLYLPLVLLFLLLNPMPA